MLKEARLSQYYLKRIKDIIPRKDPKLLASKKMSGIIPVCEPCLSDKELKYAKECIKANWISSAGKKYIREFEDRFAKLCGVKYATSCTSGTAALHLALASLGIKKGDEVIIPTFAMIAVASAVVYLEAKPILVDIEPLTYNIDPTKIEEKITKRTKAIIIVHTYGHPAQMDEIKRIAKRYKLYLIEDAAEAHGAKYKGRRIGGIGDVGCFSFYANKIITTGEGGMLTTNNARIVKMAQILKNHAFSKERHFWHKYLGYNYRLTGLAASIGLAQLENFDKLLKARIRNAKYYSSLLKNVKGITLPIEKKEVKNVFWMYSILIEDDFGLTRDDLRYCLAKKGIETRTFFIPIHLQPIYFKLYRRERFPVSEELSRKGMYLPSSSNLKKKEIDYIVGAIKDCQKKRQHKIKI
ncbi:MAG: DegT/DnrJ/EryC1/StrS family aminotransferase [Candidatus Omnitrophica bacterium]|nr:DegT/DnrJ/EryC1/StrS family aminotransferase [Candidatus Omnitrophota bacterium]